MVCFWRKKVTKWLQLDHFLPFLDCFWGVFFAFFGALRLTTHLFSAIRWLEGWFSTGGGEGGKGRVWGLGSRVSGTEGLRDSGLGYRVLVVMSRFCAGWG